MELEMNLIWRGFSCSDLRIYYVKLQLARERRKQKGTANNTLLGFALILVGIHNFLGATKLSRLNGDDDEDSMQGSDLKRPDVGNPKK